MTTFWSLYITVLTVGSLIALQVANRQVRAGLREQPDALVPLA